MGGIGEWIANLPAWAIISVVVVLGLFWLALRRMKDDKMLVGWKVKAYRETIESVIIAIVLVFGIVRPYVAQAFYIPSESMVPTLHVGDRLLVNKFVYRFHEPRRGDIIVFRAPAAADSETHKERDLVKRVVAIPGDTIEIRDHHLYVNGERPDDYFVSGFDRFGGLMEDRTYLDSGFQVYDGLKKVTDEKAKVPPGRLFVMGDNRNNSNDSRFWGALERNRVIGKAGIMFWPLNRVGLIR